MTGADEGDDVVLNLAQRQAIGTMEPDQQGEEILGHVVRIGAHQLLTVGHRLFDNAAELGEDRFAQHATDTREPGRRLEEVHRVDPAHGRQEPVDIAGEFFLAAGHLA